MNPRKPDRRDREYPHSTGDRNAWSPTGKRRQPIRPGGSQRDADPGAEPGTASEDAPEPPAGEGKNGSGGG